MAAYVRPEVVTLDSDDILELVGPVQGYAGVTRSEDPLSTMPGVQSSGSVRRM